MLINYNNQRLKINQTNTKQKCSEGKMKLFLDKTSISFILVSEKKSRV